MYSRVADAELRYVAIQAKGSLAVRTIFLNRLFHHDI